MSDVSSTDDDQSFPTRPLSRRASRVLVIASILFVIAASIGGTYYLVSLTSEALQAPADTSAADSTRVDSTATDLRPTP